MEQFRTDVQERNPSADIFPRPSDIGRRSHPTIHLYIRSPHSHYYLSRMLPTLKPIRANVLALSDKELAAAPCSDKRHSRFTGEEDLVIVRDAAASRAHLVVFGEFGKRFEIASDKINRNEAVTQKVTWKSVRDRYRRLQNAFDRDDNKTKKVGYRGEVGKLEELLMSMHNARNDLLEQRNAEKNARKE